MNETPRARLVAYGVAVLAPAASLMVRWPLRSMLGNGIPHMAFFPAVILAAYFGGLWPGLLATLLSAAAADFFLLEPRYSFAIADPVNTIALVLFLLVGTMLSILSESLHRTRRRLLANERQRAEEALRETEDRFRQLAENIHEIFWVRDARDDRMVYISPGYEGVWERTCQSLYEQPRSWVESIHPDDRGRAIEHMEQHKRGVFTDGEFRVVRPDGSIRWVRSRAFPIKDQNGAVYRIAGLAEDVTERRQTEEELRLANARIDLAVRGTNIGIWEIDMPDGDYRHGIGYHVNIWEQLGYEHLDSPADHVTGMVPVHPEDRGPLEAAMRGYLAGETGEFEVENRVRHKDGSYRWMLTRGVAVRDAGGKPIRFLGIGVDITDRKRAEEALVQERYLLHTLMDNLPDNMYFKDAASRFVRVNKALTAYFGLSDPAQALGKTDFDFYTEEHARSAYADEQEIIRTGQPVVGKEEREVWLDGRLRWVSTTKMPFRDKDGSITGTFGVSRDISRVKLAEEALRESEQRFRTFVDHATDAFFLQDERFEILDVNRQACESLGYARDELLGKTPTFFDPDVTPADLENIQRKLSANEMMAFESRHRRKDGTAFPVEIRGKAFWEGGRQFTVALVRDVTDRKAAEEALRESERRWRGLAEALPQLVWSATPDGACDYFSRQWTEHTGVPEEALLGWRWLSVLHPDDRERTRALWLESVAGRGPYDVEYRVRRADGVYRWFKARGTPIRESEGAICKWFGTCTDISDGKRLEEELRQAKEAAESANLAKDEFLANVSHEIRTPMNAILGMTELALDTPLSDDLRQCLRTVKSAADNLLGLINDLLDFSKIEAGKLELDTADFSLRSALGDTLRALAVRAHKKGLELVCHVQPDAPDALVGDAGRLRQILLNLVGNAIKFTENGEVVVRVDAVPNPESAGEIGLRFTVRDTGIGIPKDRQERIFRAFEQEDTSTTRKYGGTGLGLTIAARLAALMGGQITVESEPGRGSTFAFTARFGRQPHPPVVEWPQDHATTGGLPVELHNLPAPVVDDNIAKRHIPVPAAAPLRILAAEDNEFNAQLLEQLLVRRGHHVRLASNGREALSLAEAGAIDLMLLDVHMPELDGFQVIKAIRERERSVGGHLPVIALTARSRKEDRERCIAAGMDDFLAKPIQAASLWAAIEGVVGASRPQAERSRTDLLDPHVLLAACGGDGVILEKICQAFRACLPDHLTAIQDALRERDAVQLREAAHKFCGMAAAFSTAAGGVASELEDCTAQGQFEEARPLVGQLESMAQELMRVVDGLSINTLREQAVAAEERSYNVRDTSAH
jgi:PAS domain S-box-containing protein